MWVFCFSGQFSGDVTPALNVERDSGDIKQLVLQGTGNQSIQETLFITKNTLRTHLHNIYDKTNVHSKQELIELLLTFQD